jgi:hypothetical protein
LGPYMAKRRPDATPAPHHDLANHVTRTKWPSHRVIHRIHRDHYRAVEFNPGNGDARFSPINDSSGKRIPTVYGGTTYDCAAMETVFHDVPFAPGLKTFDKVKLIGQVHSRITPTRELIVADLRQIALRRLGIERSQLIDTEKDRYPQTRAWAAAIHDQCPDLDGLCWVSRQDDSALALLLFGDRVSSGDLLPDGEPIAIATDLNTYTRLLKLAARIGLNIIDGIV